MESSILETRSCLFQRKKKHLSFDDLDGPVKQIAIPQHGPQNKFKKIIQSRTKNIKTVYTSRLQQHQSSHTFDQISDIQRYLLASQLFLDLARQITVVSVANLHKQPEALARYYVTSYWQAEWVKKLKWKTKELPPPPPHPCLQLKSLTFPIIQIWSAGAYSLEIMKSNEKLHQYLNNTHDTI